MASVGLRVALLHSFVLLVACSAATPDELLSEARAAYAAGEWRTAEIHLKNLLQQDGNNAPARFLLGEVLYQTGDVTGAEQNLKAALDLGTAPSAVGVPLLRALIGQLKFQEALDLASSQGLPLNPADAVEVALLRGAAHRGLRQPERAVEVYRAVLATEPRSAPVRTELAATLLALGQADEGRALVQAVLTDEPNDTAALLLRGNLEVLRSERAAAEQTFQRVVDIENAAGRSQRYGLAMTQLIEMQVALGKVDAASANADAFLALNERNPLARYAKALVEAQQDNLSSAEQRLEQLIAESPQYWPAHRLLGGINIRQENFGQATMYLRNAVNNNPNDTAARQQLAELYIRQGDVDAARTLMEGSSVAASEGLFYAFAGGASQRAGLQEQANQLFDQSEQQAPSNLQQLVGLSSLYTSAGEFDRAIRLLQSSNVGDAESQDVSDYLLALIHVRRGDLQAADEVATRLQQRQAQVVWPLNLRGVIALLRSDAAGARVLFTKAREIEPNNVAATLNLARVAFVEKNAADAERYLREALQADPAQPMALLGLAQFAMERRNFTEAQALLDRAPTSPARTRGQAELFALQGRFGDAADLFLQLFTAQPSEPMALRAFDAARRAGRAEAERPLRQWHADHPQAPATNFALGSVEIAAGALAEAERSFEAVVAASGDHAAALNNLAWLYGERNDPRAIEFGKRALAASPDNPSILDTLGWLHVRNGEPATGLPLLAQAAAALPDERDVNYHWAVALADTGDSARAIELLQRVTSGTEQFSARADAERRLGELRARPR